MMMVSHSDNKYKRLRLRNDLSVAEAARRLQTSKNTLYKIESGTEPGIKLKMKMCEIYHTTLAEINKEESK